MTETRQHMLCLLFDQLNKTFKCETFVCKQARGGSRISKEEGRLTQGTNLLGGWELGGPGDMPPPPQRKILKNRC